MTIARAIIPSISHQFPIVTHYWRHSCCAFLCHCPPRRLPEQSTLYSVSRRNLHFCHQYLYSFTSIIFQRKMAPIATEITSGDNGSQTEAHPSSEECRLLFVKMTENAFAPTKGSKYAAGFDLMSAYDAVVPKRGSALIKTDIQIQLPRGTYGRIAPRSGLALKNKIDVGAGVVDEDYRGNIGVILFNHSDEDFNIAKGDRIAQLICSQIAYPEVVEVDNLENTTRGEAGFGSTGVAAKKPKLDVDVTPSETEKKVLSPTKKLNTPEVSPVKKMDVPQNEGVETN